MKRFDDLLVVFRKEVVEVVRDYKNLLVMAFIPVVFLQFMVAGTQTMMERSVVQIQKQKFKIAVYGDSDDQFLRKSIASADKEIVFVEPIGESPDQALATAKLDLAIIAPRQFSHNLKDYSNLQSIELVYDARHQNAVFAFARVHKALKLLQQRLVSERLQSAAITLPKPVEVHYFIESKKSLPDNNRSTSMILPYLLLMIVLIALLSPSLDLFTGEKERGTMPLLMVSPVAPQDIVLGKLAVVFLFGQTTVSLGLLSFFVMVNFFGRGTTSLISFHGVGAGAMLLLFVLMIPLVLLLSALSVILASKCKTFQQGQGYYLPFMLIALLPASVLSFDNSDLSSVVALLPVGNICLAMRDVLSRNYDWLSLSIIFFVSSIYALLAVYQAIHLFDRHEQLDRESAPGYVRWRNGDFRLEVILLLAAAFLLMFYLGQLLQTWDSLWGTALSQLLVVLLPALATVKLLRLPLRRTLSLNRPSWQSLLGALLVTPLAAFISLGVSQLQSQVLPVPESFAQAFLEMVMPAGRSLPLAVLVFAVFPAICEEILFRGAVLGLLRKKLSRRTLIIAVGLLFGAFHLSTYRFLPTALLGIALSSIVVFSGSIYPAMVLHACHNACLIVAQVNHWEHLSLPQILSLSLVSLTGIALLFSACKSDAAP